MILSMNSTTKALEQQLAALDDAIARIERMIAECPSPPSYNNRSNDRDL
jgi:hypothetical protein